MKREELRNGDVVGFKHGHGLGTIQTYGDIMYVVTENESFNLTTMYTEDLQCWYNHDYDIIKKVGHKI